MKDMYRQIQNRKRDGGTAAVLFFALSLSLFAAATFAATWALMPGGDTALQFVPQNAVAYVHASGAKATQALLQSSPEMPTDVRPYEVSLFVVPGDEAPRRGVILGWRKAFGPSEAEAAALAERGAAELDARHYFIGDADLATAARVSQATGSSLADHAAFGPALAEARAVSRTQAMVFPRLISTTDSFAESSSPLADFMPAVSPEPQIITVNMHGNAYTAHALSLSEALAGDAKSSATPQRQPLELSGVAADVAITELQPSFDLASLFDFAPEPSEDPNEALPVAFQAIAVSEEALRTTLNAQYAFWLRTGSDHQPFLLHFPSVSTTESISALMNVYAAYHPKRREITLPDGMTVNELTASAPDAPIRTENGDVFIGAEAPIQVGSDGRNGSLITNAPEMIQAFRGTVANALSQTAPCPTHSANLRLTPNVAAAIPFLKPFVRNINGNPLLLTQGVGKGVYVCGYF